MKWLLRNLHLKVIAFFVTLTLYAFVLSEKKDERTFRVTLEPGGNPPGYILLSELPNVDVRIAGSNRSFARLDADALQVHTLRPFHADDATYILRETDFRLPPGLDVVDLTPRDFPVQLDAIREIDLPIQMNTRGEPALGYEVTDREVTPARIRVQGPDTYLEGMDAIFTEVIDLTGRTRSIHRRVDLTMTNPFVAYDPALEITARIEIEPIEGQRTLDGVGIVLAGAHPAGFHLEARQPAVAVEVHGPQAVVDGLEATALFAVIDVSAIDPERADTVIGRPVVRNLPPSVEVLSIDPAEILLDVTALPPPPEPEPETPPEGSGAGQPLQP